MVCSTAAEFSASLSIGTRYETYIYEFLQRTLGLRIRHFCGKGAQRLGENAAGLEIKYDGRWQQTGHLYIETADRVDGGGGIYRQNNTRNLLIGDYDKCWVFSISQLRQLDQMVDVYDDDPAARPVRVPHYKHVENPRSNSRGFLLPVADADRLCRMRANLTREVQS